MHAVTKEKDETIKKLRSEVERVREENDEMSRARPAEVCQHARASCRITNLVVERFWSGHGGT